MFIFYVLIEDYIANSHFTLAVYGYKGRSLNTRISLGWQSGKKVELVARAFKAYELGAPKNFTQELIFDSIQMEYQQRLQTNDIIKSDPNTLCDEYWKDDTGTWPHLDDGMLHSTNKGSGC